MHPSLGALTLPPCVNVVFALTPASLLPCMYEPRGTLVLSGAGRLSSQLMRSSDVQLALFHALFTWLTLRMFETHFVYASTLASAIFALLPFIPSWLVAFPAAIQLFIQVGHSLCYQPAAPPRGIICHA